MSNQKTRTDVEQKLGLHAIVHGRVQAVNFRYYAVRAAQQMGLTGWIANRWNRTVETVAEGSRDPLEQYLAFLREGSPLAIVRKVDVEWRTATHEFDDFQVRYSR